MATVGRDDGRGGLRRVVLFLVQLKDHLGTHAGPDHGVELQDGQKSRDRSVVRYVVEVDGAVLAFDDGSEVCGELPDPDAPGGGGGPQRVGAVAVHLAVLPVSKSVDCVGKLLGHTCCAVGAIDKFTRQRLIMALTSREVVEVMVKGSVETVIVGRDAGDVIESGV